MIIDFVDYCKKKFNIEVRFEKSDNPTTFDSIFKPNNENPFSTAKRPDNYEYDWRKNSFGKPRIEK